MNIYKLCVTISLFIFSYILSKLREKCFGKKILEVITLFSSYKSNVSLQRTVQPTTVVSICCFRFCFL